MRSSIVMEAPTRCVSFAKRCCPTVLAAAPHGKNDQVNLEDAAGSEHEHEHEHERPDHPSH
jgi:hypothetical protein